MDDDFDRLFGERPPPPALPFDIANVNGYGSWLPSDALPPPNPTAATADPKMGKARTGTPGALMNMSRAEASTLIKEILARKPPPISPTLPKLEGDLDRLRQDPLDLHPPPAPATAPPARETNSGNSSGNGTSKRHRSTSEAAPAPTTLIRKSHSTPRVGATDAAKRPTGSATRSSDRHAVEARGRSCSPPPKVSSSGSGKSSATPRTSKRKGPPEHLTLMRTLYDREQFSDTVDEWRSMITRIDRLEVIEMAKRPREDRLIATLALTVAWIAEHLVDLLLRRTQLRAVTRPDSASVLTDLATIMALREQAKQSHLRALHLDPDLSAAVGPHMALPVFIAELVENTTV